MSTIYRKSVKGVEEVAFKSSGLPMRLTSYLLAVDGESSVDQLTARHPNLPSLGLVLQGLVEQGFLETVGASESLASRAPAFVDSSSPSFGNSAQSAPANAQSYNKPAPMQTNRGQELELDKYKASMVRDVSMLLGADASPVIQKIQACNNRDDLFVTMMGIKKIITIYKNRVVAEKFASRYLMLSS